MSYVAGHGGSSGESSDFHAAGLVSELSSLPRQCWVDRLRSVGWGGAGAGAGEGTG